MKLAVSVVCFVMTLAWLFATADELALGSQRVQLKAQARACYLGFIKLYDIDYFADPADGAGARCVRVSYLRGFSADELGEATFKVFRERHGDALTQRYRAQLTEVESAYRSVQSGDRYTYCVNDSDSGILMRDGSSVISFSSDDFAERFLQIWVKRERQGGEPEWGFGSC